MDLETTALAVWHLTTYLNLNLIPNVAMAVKSAPRARLLRLLRIIEEGVNNVAMIHPKESLRPVHFLIRPLILQRDPPRKRNTIVDIFPNHHLAQVLGNYLVDGDPARVLEDRPPRSWTVSNSLFLMYGLLRHFLLNFPFLCRSNIIVLYNLHHFLFLL